MLPAVPSTTVPPGLSLPDFSACSIIERAARSLTDPPGLRNSALPKISQPVSSLKLLSLIRGVLPTVPTNPDLISIAAYISPFNPFILVGNGRFSHLAIRLD